jgi:hypothetical protein
MPSVQTEYNMGGPVQGYSPGGIVRIGTALAPIASRALAPLNKVARPGRTINLDGGKVDVTKLAKGMDMPKQTFGNYKKLGKQTLQLGAGIGAITAFKDADADFGEDTEALDQELQDAFEKAREAGNSEGGAREFITQLGGNPEGNVKDELDKIYNGVSGKNIPVSQRDKLEGSIQAIVGAATMAAKGNDMERIAAGLGAGAKIRGRMAEDALKAKKTSAYTPERLYQQSIDAILRGPEENIPMKNSGRLNPKGNPIMEPDYEKVKSIARSLAGMDGSTSSSASTPEAALKMDPSPEMRAMYDQKYGKGSAAKVLGG